ncbi:tetratricopeptide repeat protein [Streptomyces althioticus]|uniref:tetratricopeptide repeat protein n=2 Tax=Streptomyces althioticus TaxID=83380 RepID=UPI0037924F71
MIRTRMRNHPLHRDPGIDDLPRTARPLAVALASAVRIEPELIRGMRLHVRPTLDVGAESGLWFGPWAAHRGRQYMALRRPVLHQARELLVEELARSSPTDPIRRAGQVIEEAHHHLPPVLAVEERVTWAALTAEAGLDHPDTADVDALLQSVLRAAVEDPRRRDGLRRWFAQAWERLPRRVRQTSTALDLNELLGPSSHHLFFSSAERSSVSPDIQDVVLPVRHDGNVIAFGDSTWPADGILVPDTQPRILQLTHDLDAWESATEVRVPRGGFTAAEAAHVPLYVRTARGLVYRVGAPGGSEVISRPPSGRPGKARLLGRSIQDLHDRDYPHFGIAPDLRAVEQAGLLLPRLTRYRPTSVDADLRHAITMSSRSEIVLVQGAPGSGRTRTAWEAVRATRPTWWIWSPPPVDRNQTVLQALAEDGIGSHTVLWLDDIDQALADPRTGENLASALLDLLDDSGREPVLVAATAMTPPATPRLGPSATLLLHQALFFTLPPTGHRSASPYARLYPTGALPPALPALPGRRGAVESILHGLLPENTMPVLTAITGVPGTGKSVMAVQAAHLARERGWFTGGVLMATVGGDRPFWAALLQALGAGRTRHLDEQQARLLCVAHLMLMSGPTRRTLLVLDDVTEEELRDIAAVAPTGLALLATSRRTLSLAGATVVELGPLPEDDAVHVLEHSLKQRDPDDRRLRVQPEATRQVVALCGCFPLALTTAAAWLTADPHRTVADLEVMLRLCSALELEHKGERPVTRALDLAFHGAAPDDQRAFCLLAMLPGTSFTTALARVLFAEHDTVDARLDSLAQHHLISGREEPGRWAMHPILQTYGRSNLLRHVTREEADEALQRVVEAQHTRALAADRTFRKNLSRRRSGRDVGEHDKAIAWLQEEHENLIALSTFCFQHGREAKGAAIALRLATFLFHHKEFAPLLQLMQLVYEWSKRSGDRSAAAAALNNLAVTSAATGDFQQARAIMDTAAELLDAEHQRTEYLRLLSNLGAVLLETDHTREAITLLTDALSEHRRERPVALMSLLCNLGAALHQAGRTEQALQTLLQAEQLVGQHSLSPAEEGHLLHNLAEVLKTLGRIDEATERFRRAVGRFEELGDRATQARLHRELGALCLRTERLEEAHAHFMAARHLFASLDDPVAEAHACTDFGLALHRLGRPDEALEQMLSARTLYQQGQSEHEAALSLRNIGTILLDVGRFTEAIPALRNAGAHLEALGDPHGEAQVLHRLGNACEQHGDLGSAVMALSDSAALYTRIEFEQTYQHRAEAAERPATAEAVADQAHAENALRDEADVLVHDLLRVSHLLSAADERAGADTALRAAARLVRRFSAGSEGA